MIFIILTYFFDKKESLDINLQIEIIDDFKKTNELSEALNALKIIINYAMTASSNSNEPVINFMKKIYTDLEIKTSEVVLKNKVKYSLLIKASLNYWNYSLFYQFR